MKVVVLISGKKGSGKTTTANALSHKYTIMAFADCLKDIVNQIGGFSGYSVPKDTPCGNKTYGQMLQETGTFIRCNFGEDYFVDRVIEKINNCSHNYIAIHDLRYLNEMEKMMTTEHRIITVRLFGRTSEDSRDTSHRSECDLDNYSGKWDLMFNTLVFEVDDIVKDIETFVKYGQLCVKC